MNQDDKPNVPQENSAAKGAVALNTLNDAASLVANYAARLLNDKRAQQFYAQLSLMAKENKKIAMCTPSSVLTAMMACVHLDLMPNTPQQHAFVIPYNNKQKGTMELQFQLGYKGLLVLAERSGQVLKIEAQLVFKGDKFSYALGLKPRLTHTPSMTVDRTQYENVIAAYAVIKLRNNEVVFDVMGRPELDKIQDVSKASATDTPWKKWPESMAKKTIVKRALKLIPSSTADSRLEYAAIYDSWAEAGKLRAGIDGKLLQAQTDKTQNEAEIKAKAKDILNNLDQNETTEGDDPHAIDVSEPEPTDDAEDDTEIVDTTPPPKTLQEKIAGEKARRAADKVAE